MNKLLNGIVCLVILFAVSATNAAGLKDETMDELMILSGTQTQAQDMLSSIRTLVRSRSGEAAQHVDLLEQMIQPDQLVSDVRAALKSNLSEEEAQQVLKWYSSNLGNRIAAAEEAAASPQAMQEIQAMAAKLVTDTEKMAMASELIDASGFYDTSMNTQAVMSLVAEVMSVKQAGAEGGVDVDHIKRFIAKQQAAMQAQLKNFLQIMVAYTYRDFSKDELNRYKEVLQSPYMKKFNQLGQDASLASIEGMVRKLAAQ